MINEKRIDVRIVHFGMVKMTQQCYMFSLFVEFHNILQMERKGKAQWSTQESQLLVELVPQFTSKRWKRISQQFRKRGHFRRETECRERWVNFLAPGVNRRDWQPWELRKLYEVHAQVGTRWCQVQKTLNRSQNQIKNRFYGTLRNFIRGVLGFFDPARMISNCPVAKLSPNYLNCLYNSTAQFSNLVGQVRTAIFEMGYRVDRQMLAARIEAKRGVYAQLNGLLLKDFAQLFDVGRQERVVPMTDSNFNNSPIQDYTVAAPAMMGLQTMDGGAVLLACQPPAVFWFY